MRDLSKVDRLVGTVFVNAPGRNIGDDRPIVGEYPVVEVLPHHLCGPVVMVQDEYGVTAVLWSQCLPIMFPLAALKALGVEVGDE